MSYKKIIMILIGIFITIFIYSENLYKYNQKNYNHSEDFFKEFFSQKEDHPEVKWCRTQTASLPLGSSVYLLSDEQLIFIGWYNNDETESVSKSSDGTVVKTKGKKIGFYVETVSGKVHTFYTHLNPDSGAAKSLIKVFDLAKKANIKFIALPKNTKIGEVGISGDADKPEIIILQYELLK